ncbi:hypothetical protein [Actinoplanes awajinensis]|uniref:Uncharacterized protein n=1 Tax=Actinoplanes awajinensis subsp. mycoplanecinus TaxID=135947 RepID=A0A101JF52_9ACTN|nr:hypothetical protein [Actinoplanes awajinensis]KUL25589.1 hypothetical protein ADL15_40300 [Actinoplanes awajinensis subsp. mycoplanecinus]
MAETVYQETEEDLRRHQGPTLLPVVAEADVPEQPEESSAALVPPAFQASLPSSTGVTPRKPATPSEAAAKPRSNPAHGVIHAAGTPIDRPWVPTALLGDIQNRKVGPGVYVVPYTWPQGWQAQQIVDVGTGGDYRAVRFYRLYPEDLAFWLQQANGDTGLAKELQEKWVRRNKDMLHYIVGLRVPAEFAEAELQRIDDEIYRAKAGAFGTVLGLGAAISSVGAMATRGAARQPANAGSPAHTGAPQEKAVAGAASQETPDRTRFLSDLAAKVSSWFRGSKPPAPSHPVTPAKAPSSSIGKLFYKPTIRSDPTMAAGRGETDPLGNVVYSSQGTATDVNLVKNHEIVHSILSPKLRFLQNFRAEVRSRLYGIPNFDLTAGQPKTGSSLLRYLEEAIAESYAQLHEFGIRGLPAGIRFPIENGYVELLDVVTEAAIGTIVYGGVTYGVYLHASEPAQPGQSIRQEQTRPSADTSAARAP